MPDRARGVGVKLVMGLTLGAVAIAALVAGPLPLLFLLLGLVIVAAGELFRLLRRRGMRPLPLVGFAGIIAAFVVAYRYGERAPIVLPGVVAGVLGLTFLGMLARRQRHGSAMGVASTLLAVVYLGVLGSYIVVLRRSPDGFSLTLVFGLMAVLHDAGAYFAGITLGRRRMAPTVSPDKTWEGWFGGTLAAFAVAVVAALALDPPFTWASALVLAVLVSAAAPLGDLSESVLKRDAGAKDAGKILPGHGGVLDRIDSVVFSAPIFFYAYRVLAK